jgi:ubiquinone/menaquinone biosynthesis C-methylase UbiE
MSWEMFERAAGSYEDWYSGPRGQRADRAERGLLDWLFASFPDARSLLEIGCGTGHFSGWLAARSIRVVGLERAPAMLAEMRRNLPGIPAVLGDAHRLPFRDGVSDLVLFVTTLEFLDDPERALVEAVRVARQGIVLVVLNRWSVGGLSRRWGSQANKPLLGRARDYSLSSLRAAVARVAGQRRKGIRWASSLFPAFLWEVRAKLPLGDVIGLAVCLASPATWAHPPRRL